MFSHGNPIRKKPYNFKPAFFTKYPAVVDEAIGAPFRQAGPVVTGLYNYVFSGMQAYSRAELAGKSKKESRKLMEQYMVAEGLKKKGSIKQLMNWLGGKQDKYRDAQALTTEAIEEETKKIVKNIIIVIKLM